jgi:hypothetical protein
MSDIAVRIYGDFNDSGFKKASKSTSGLEKSFKKLAKTIGGVFAVQQIVAFGKASVKAFADDEAAARRLTQTLGNMGLAFEDPRIKGFIADLEATSGVLDDQLRPAFQQLLTTTGSVTKAQELLTLALDVAAGSSESVTTVAYDLTKAYVGQTKSLAKYSIGLTQAELKGKSFAEIQQLLNNQFAGQNAAYLETYAGKVSILNVAFANLQETIGKGLVDSFLLLAGDNGIGAATKSMEDFAQKTSDAIYGTAVLLDRLNTKFGKFGGRSLGEILYASLGGGLIDALSNVGKAARTAPKPFTTPMTISGQTDFYKKQDAARKKADAAAAKRNKEIAALQKKTELERLKREKEAQQLKRAGTVFDMENIQIVAALQGRIDGEQRLRLIALLAINNEVADVAEQTTKAILAMNAPAFAALGTTIKVGDSSVDVINKLLIAQTKVALLQLGIKDLPKANNPFEDWDAIIAKILSGLASIQKGLQFTMSVNGAGGATGGGATGGGTIGGGATGGGATGGGVGVGGSTVTVVGGSLPIDTSAVVIELPNGNLVNPFNTYQVAGANILAGSGTALTAMANDTAAETNARQRIADIFATIGTFGRGGFNESNVTVNIAGSVLTEGELKDRIIEGLYEVQKRGQNITLNAVAI